MLEVCTRRRRRPPVQAIEPEPGRMSLTVPEAAYLLHCHPNTVWALVRSGELRSFQLRRKRLIARAALEELISRGTTTSQA